MNGVHAMGGMHGMGPVAIEKNEPGFHSDWEARVHARGRRGTVERDHGVFIFPATHAMTRDRKPQHCYSVRFAARELWGPGASARDGVYVDLWDDHLDPA